MEHPVPVSLGHLGVDVEAAEPELGDLLGQKLNSLRRVAEDDRLVDLQLREERVQAVNLKEKQNCRFPVINSLTLSDQKSK